MNDSNVPIVVHVDETLSASEIHALEKYISKTPGVHAACTPERAPHLMIVDYDPRLTLSREILNTVRHRGYHAELVGI